MAVGFPAKDNFANGNVLDASELNDISGTLNLLSPVGQAAGKALTANGSGGVTWADAPVPASIVDAKGDLIVATGADAVTRLPVGSNGQSLVADSTQASGVKWSTPSGMTYYTQTFLSTTTWTLPSSSTGYVDLFIQAGGGGGGRPTNNGTTGGGGGAPGTFAYYPQVKCAAGTSLTVTVGGGGNGATALSSSGSTGTASSVAGIPSWGTLSAASGYAGSASAAINGAFNYTPVGIQSYNNTGWAFYSFGFGPWSYSQPANGSGTGTSGGAGSAGKVGFANPIAFGSATNTTLQVTNTAFPVLPQSLVNAAAGSNGGNGNQPGGVATGSSAFAGQGGNGGSTGNGGDAFSGAGGGGGGHISGGTAGAGGAASANSGSGGGGGGGTTGTTGNGGNGGSGFVVIGYWA